MQFLDYHIYKLRFDMVQFERLGPSPNAPMLRQPGQHPLAKYEEKIKDKAVSVFFVPFLIRAKNSLP